MTYSKPILVRDQDEAIIGGVMAGVARRMGWDMTILRIAFVIVSIASAAFPGTAVYLLLWAIMPDELGRRSPAPWVLGFFIFLMPVVLIMCAALTMFTVPWVG